MKRKNIISITVLNLLQIPNLDFSENFLVSCPNLQSFWLFVLQYTKEKAIKMNFLVILFHWIETERIAKNLIEISKFELSIEKTKKNRQQIWFISLWCQVYIFVLLEKLKKNR